MTSLLSMSCMGVALINGTPLSVFNDNERTNFCLEISLGCLRISTGPCQLTAQKEKWIKLRTVLRHYLTGFLKLQRKEYLKDAEEMAEEWSTMAAFAKDLDLVCTQQLPVVCNSSFRRCMPLLASGGSSHIHGAYIHTCGIFTLWWLERKWPK